MSLYRIYILNFIFSILSVAYIIGIFLSADSPIVFNISSFNSYSLLHIPLYGILTFVLIFSIIPVTRPKGATGMIDSQKSGTGTNAITITIPPLLTSGLIAFGVAIADEIHQAYVPCRDASVTDVLLDIIGIGLVMLLILKLYPRIARRLDNLMTK